MYLPASPSSDPPRPRELLLNKQTSALPLDTQLGCGDLLRLSSRILNNAVASVNKSKAPGSQTGDVFVENVDYLPHTPFCLSPIVWRADRMRDFQCRISVVLPIVQ